MRLAMQSAMRSAARPLFHLARRLALTRWGAALVRRLFVWSLPMLPVTRLLETETLLAFQHPHPAYRVHILLAPRRPIPHLAALTPADSAFMLDLFASVAQLVQTYHLEAGGYRLIANGGAYQDFPQLHFHLISD